MRVTSVAWRAVLAGLLVASSTAHGQAAMGAATRPQAVPPPELSAADAAKLARQDELSAAIVRKDAARVRALIRAGMPLDFNFDEVWRGRTSQSPLTLAIGRGHLEVAAVLLEAGADPRRADGFGQAPLHYARTPEAIALLERHGAAAIEPPRARGPASVADAIEAGNADEVRALLGKGADPSAPGPWGAPITRALFRQRWDIAAVLAEAGANLKLSDGAGCASTSRDCHAIEIARLASLHAPTLAILKARGLDLNACSANGHSALTSLIVEPALAVASVHGGARVDPPDAVARVRTLLEQGADANRRCGEATPLMLAVAALGKPRSLALAIAEHGGRIEYRGEVRERPNAPATAPSALPAGGGLRGALPKPIEDIHGIHTRMGIGPLTWAVLQGRPDVAARLLARDRKVEREDRDLLYFLAVLGEWDVLMQALPYTREVNAADRVGVTPLMLAADDGRLDAVKALVAAGARIDARSERHWRPIWEEPIIARLSGHGGASPRLAGGYTALRAARERGHAQIERVLLQAGARD